MHPKTPEILIWSRLLRNLFFVKILYCKYYIYIEYVMGQHHTFPNHFRTPWAHINVWQKRVVFKISNCRTCKNNKFKQTLPEFPVKWWSPIEFTTEWIYHVIDLPKLYTKFYQHEHKYIIGQHFMNGRIRSTHTHAHIHT